jgi:hypothetical protein
MKTNTLEITTFSLHNTTRPGYLVFSEGTKYLPRYDRLACEVTKPQLEVGSYMEERRSQIILSILRLVSFLGTILLNWLPINLPINDKATVQLAAGV